MRRLRLEFSAESRARVVALTALGTLVCIAVAFAIDGYSNDWQWGQSPWNNLLIPLVLAPPFFYLLLSRQRELSIAHRELFNLASTDSLTACLNRRAFTTLVDGYIERVREQEQSSGALLLVDIDHFKRVNDTYGHDRGDEALKLIAQTIRASVREVDLVGRLGGEEFSVFLPSAEPPVAVAVAERIRAEVRALDFSPAGARHELSVSVGGTTFETSPTFAELYRHADLRLYSAKRNGRNRVELLPFPPKLARAG